MNKKQSIGVFDSGIGGLNVLNNLVEEFPNENFLYVGDNLTYKVNVTPENATDKTYKIISKDSNILAVDGLKVVGKKAGSTTLTFTSNDDMFKSDGIAISVLISVPSCFAVSSL